MLIRLFITGVFFMAAIGSSIVSSIPATDPSSIQQQIDAILAKVPENHFFPADQMKAFLAKYSPEELEAILLDYADLYKKIFADAKQSRDYIVTAGGPASGKSTLLETMTEGRAYVDPDRSCLQKMENTYLADINWETRTPHEAYEHWRDASNFLSNVFLAIALDKGYEIAHGSTMATPRAKNALGAIKTTYGYNVTILHVSCDEEVRKASEAKRREGGVVQCTDKDFEEKNALFYTLLGDYVDCSDCLKFYDRSEMGTMTHAATHEKGRLTVHDRVAFDRIKSRHSEAVWEKAFPKDEAASPNHASLKA